MSMKPGARTRPFASITRSCFSGLKFPIRTMWSPTMRTLALRRGFPVPSATCALTITVGSPFGEGTGGVCAQRGTERRQNTSIAFERYEVHLRIVYSFAETSILPGFLKKLSGFGPQATGANAIPNDDQADRDGEDEGGDGVDLRSDALAEAAPDFKGESIVAADEEEGDCNFIHRKGEDQKAGGDEREFEIGERDAPKGLPRCCAEIERSFFLGAIHFLETREKVGGCDGNERSAVAEKNREEAELDSGEDGEHEEGEAGNDARKD